MTKEALDCLKANVYNGISTGSKTVDPQSCFKASKQCCFINITHIYGGITLIEEYCNYLNVNISEFKQFLFNMYNDNSLYYANFTTHNTENYKTIGRNIYPKLIDNVNCYLGPKSREEFSTYAERNCKDFKDGIKKIRKI